LKAAAPLAVGRSHARLPTNVDVNDSFNPVLSRAVQDNGILTPPAHADWSQHLIYRNMKDRHLRDVKPPFWQVISKSRRTLKPNGLLLAGRRMAPPLAERHP
jgi:hypothetical protein